RTDATAPAVAEILKEVRRLATEGATSAELATAKDAIVRALPSAFETSGSTVGTLSGLYLYDLGLDYYTRYPGMVGAVNAVVVKTAAAKYVPAGRLIVV